MNMLELFGVILGDGNVSHYPSKGVYFLLITGNADDEQDYFEEIKKFIENKTGRYVGLRTRHEVNGKSLRLQVSNKVFVEYLMHEFELQSPKTFTARIPQKYLPWEFSRHIIRGIFESDGSLFFSRMHPDKLPIYPRLEIKTSSLQLRDQLMLVLDAQRFNVHRTQSRTDRTYRVYVSGYAMLERWVKEIGLSSQKNMTKYLFWKKHGYYVPRISLRERQKLLQKTATRAEAGVYSIVIG